MNVLSMYTFKSLIEHTHTYTVTDNAIQTSPTIHRQTEISAFIFNTHIIKSWTHFYCLLYSEHNLLITIEHLQSIY